MFSKELRLLTDYTHLNLPLKKFGLANGKGAAILLFASMKHPYSKQTSLNLLEEVLGELSTQVSINFGSGLGGLACLIDHLSSLGHITQDINELLSETESKILELSKKAELNDISINSGISGIGLLFLKRLASQPIIQTNKKQVYLKIITNLFENGVNSHSMHVAQKMNDYSIWTGLSGYMLFLIQGGNVLCFEHHPKIAEVLRELLGSLDDKSVPTWDKVEIYFVLLIACLKENDPVTNHVLNTLHEFVTSSIAKIHEIDLKSGFFLAMLLTIIAKKFEILKIEQLSQAIISHVKSEITNDKISVLFPANNHDRSIDVGIQSGTCGLALPLYSLEHNDYSWLSLIISNMPSLAARI